LREDKHAATGDLSHRASAEILRREIPHANFLVLPVKSITVVSAPAAVHKASKSGVPVCETINK
jgi:hypothetical protein